MTFIIIFIGSSFLHNGGFTVSTVNSLMEINHLHRKGLDDAVINSFMLRFRPIAPKPTSGESRQGAIDLIGKPRPKRKYLGHRKNGGRCGNRRTELAKPDADHVVEAETMRLKVSVPTKDQVPPSKVVKVSEGWGGADSCSQMKSWLEDETALPMSRIIPRAPLLPHLNAAGSTSPLPDPTVETTRPRCRRILETWLIVESVATDARSIQRVGVQPQQQQLGRTITDEERVRGLAGDTCPGFVTDVDHLIRWVNGACERMVRQRLAIAGRGGEAAVWMVAKEDLPYSCPAFTCRVRILYTWQDEGCPMCWEGPRGVTVAPCDAWRLDSGGFAWRLDVEAALTLGR